MSAAPPIRALTSLRGLAAWWVVVFHFREALPPQMPEFLHGIASYGYLAVDLFFILSGFVISCRYSEYFSTRIEIRNILIFYGLRLARIYPLHFFVLIIYLINPIAIIIFSNKGLPGDSYEIYYYILSIFLIQNWGWTNTIQWNIPAWSISTEWFAYLIFPFFAIIMARVIKNAIAAALALLLILAMVTALVGGGLGGNIPHYGLLRCVLEFGAGIALYRLHLAHPAQIATARLAFGCAIFCFVALIILPDYAVIPLGFFCLIYSLTENSFLLSRLISQRLLEWIGLISYSTYMIHYFVKIWIKFLLVDSTPNMNDFAVYIAATLGVSVLLFYCIERPAQQKMRLAVTNMLAPLPRTALSP